VLLAIMLIGCGQAGRSPALPIPADCGPGLAATDLAGNCRAKPHATMGALEAVS